MDEPRVPPVALARDFPADVVRRRVRHGEWRRVTRGAYVAPRRPEPGAAPDGGPRGARQLALARALGVHLRLTGDHVFSRETAALAWGLPLWRAPSLTHVLVPYRAGTGRDPAVARHYVDPLPSVDVRVGLPVTSLARTVVDCAATLFPGEGLVVVDAALRLGVTRAALDDAVDDLGRARGVRRARAVVALADPGAESPGESMARYVVLRDGLAVPETQIRVPTRLGVFRSDLGWPAWRLLLEYDGRDKYRGDADAFAREKRRHDALVEAGYRVLRVTKEDLAGRGLTLRVLAAAPGAGPLRPRPDLRA